MCQLAAYEATRMIQSNVPIRKCEPLTWKASVSIPEGPISQEKQDMNLLYPEKQEMKTRPLKMKSTNKIIIHDQQKKHKNPDKSNRTFSGYDHTLNIMLQRSVKVASTCIRQVKKELRTTAFLTFQSFIRELEYCMSIHTCGKTRKLYNPHLKMGEPHLRLHLTIFPFQHGL